MNRAFGMSLFARPARAGGVLKAHPFPGQADGHAAAHGSVLELRRWLDGSAGAGVRGGRCNWTKNRARKVCL
jgi:hypothetical protein